MDLIDKIAFVIEDRGWKNCHLIDFVVKSTKEKRLQEDLIDESTLKKLKQQEIKTSNNGNFRR